MIYFTNPNQYSDDGESKVRVSKATEEIANLCEALMLSPSELEKAVDRVKANCFLTRR